MLHFMPHHLAPPLAIIHVEGKKHKHKAFLKVNNKNNKNKSPTQPTKQPLDPSLQERGKCINTHTHTHSHTYMPIFMAFGFVLPVEFLAALLPTFQVEYSKQIVVKQKKNLMNEYSKNVKLEKRKIASRKCCNLLLLETAERHVAKWWHSATNWGRTPMATEWKLRNGYSHLHKRTS